MNGGKEHRPSHLHKYLGGLGVEPPKEKEAKKERKFSEKKFEIKDGIFF